MVKKIKNDEASNSVDRPVRENFSEENYSAAGEVFGLEDGGFNESKPPAKNELNLFVWAQSIKLHRHWHLFEGLFQRLPLFKDLFLIIRPAAVWNRIEQARHGIIFTFLFYLLPMMFVTSMAEGHGLIVLGRNQVTEGMHNRFTLQMVCVYEIGSMLVMLVFIFLTAMLIKSFANTCHARNHLSESLVVMLHTVGPLLLIQCLNGFPYIYFWLTWAIGISLAIAALYQGLPRIMKPDLPSAMGLFVGSSITFFLLMLVWRILTNFYLSGQLRLLEKSLSRFVGQ